MLARIRTHYDRMTPTGQHYQQLVVLEDVYLADVEQRNDLLRLPPGLAQIAHIYTVVRPVCDLSSVIGKSRILETSLLIKVREGSTSPTKHFLVRLIPSTILNFVDREPL